MKTTIPITLLSLCLAQAQTAPTVSAVSAVQRVGTQWVDISYNLTDPDSSSITVAIQASSDGGSTWTVPVNTKTGSIGAGVAPGNGKSIAWNAGADWPNGYSTTMKFRVTADDGYVAPPPVVGGFVEIPAGYFTMGDATGIGYSYERPTRSVYVNAFYMGTHEVSYSEWQTVYNWAIANGYTFSNAGAGKAANHPVHTISWWDVVKWCNAKSEKDGRSPAYTVASSVFRTGTSGVVACNFGGTGYRLPTEAEWEKAARGGLAGKNFPWGDTITHSQANYYSYTPYSYDISPTRGYHPTYATGSKPYTSPIGSFAANGFGLYDMSGNVLEWCFDWYGSGYYADASAGTNPSGPATGSYRVFRGGSWNDVAVNTRAAYRDSYAPGAGGDGDDYFGFRLARGQ